MMRVPPPMLIGGAGLLCLIALWSWYTLAPPPHRPPPHQTGYALEDTHPLTGTAALHQQRRPFAPRPILHDDFSRPTDSLLTGGTSGGVRARVAKGRYTMQLDAPDTAGWSLLTGTYQDIAIQIESSTPAQEATVASGLIFRYQDSDNFSLFNVASNGLYSLERVHQGTWSTLIGWTPSHAIHTSTTSTTSTTAPRPITNTLRLETRGPYITMMVNGEVLETTMERRMTSGKVGVAITTFAHGAGVVSFDNLSLFQKRE